MILKAILLISQIKISDMILQDVMGFKELILAVLSLDITLPA